MGRQVTVVLYVVAMAAIIVGVDFAFFRNRFWERLAVNIGIVLVFGAFYWRFLRPPFAQLSFASGTFGVRYHQALDFLGIKGALRCKANNFFGYDFN